MQEVCIYPLLGWIYVYQGSKWVRLQGTGQSMATQGVMSNMVNAKYTSGMY